MNTPKDLRYTKSHEWVRVEGGMVTVGITDHAQEQIGEVVAVAGLVDVDEDVTAGKAICEVESVKAVSEVYAPIAGRVVALNEGLDGGPEAVNEDCYGEGWLFVIEPANPADIDALLSAEDYAASL